MKSVFLFDILKLATSTRMLKMLGEGELEIKNQGRFGYSTGFTQETGATDQQTPRIGVERPKRRELSAGRTLNSDSTPHFLFYVFPWLDCDLFAGLFAPRSPVAGFDCSTVEKKYFLPQQPLRVPSLETPVSNSFMTTRSRSRKWGIQQGARSVSGGYR